MESSVWRGSVVSPLCALKKGITGFGSMKSVLAFYKFLEIPDLEDLRFDLLDQGAFLDLKGTILIAHEGINSTLVGNKKNLEKFSVWLTDRFGFFPFKVS